MAGRLAVEGHRTPDKLREGVRSRIADALERDAELRGARTARLLLAAGALGIFAAIGMIRIISDHPYGHHPGWHVVFFTAIWSGLLVVMLAIALLGVRTPLLPLARASRVAILGLGIAGICSVLCPDPHFLVWWGKTRAGDALGAIGGVPLSALCFGAVTTVVFSLIAALVALGRREAPIQPMLPAAMLLLLLFPGIALQSVGTSWWVFSSWLVGTGVGAYAGIATAIAMRTRFSFA
jgi:hypothetical protein